ncbi:hypothetical protein K1719_045369 [Acacia pycnantha]|nr:hypothetical protein K1719_045369 [Acacia pycnantha]
MVSEKEKRASEQRRRTVIGGREGSKEGNGDGDGGGDKGKGSAGFTFGRMADKKKGGEAGPQGPNASQSSGPPPLSYRDKLLSSGCARFLMKHSEEDDIVKGWKDYFHRMNERDVRSVPGDVEVEEDDQTVGRIEGRMGELKFTADEYTAWCLPWMNSLIIKALGARFPTYIIRDCINRMWRPKDPLNIVPLSNGYYIVSFSNKEDREYAFQEGPWMIDDHYLIVQRWRPNFNPWKADLQCRVSAWIRLPDVPFEFYNVESLRRIGNMIGKMIKVDRATSIYDKGGFARICVEIDLKQPLIPSYTVFGEERPIIYEGLHQVCFQCGRYGHSKDNCPMKKVEGKNTQKPIEPEIVGSGGDQTKKGTKLASGSDKTQTGTKVHRGGDKGVKETEKGSGGNRTVEETEVGGGVYVITSDAVAGASPFRKIQILKRDFCRPPYSAGLRYDAHKISKANGVSSAKPDIKVPISVDTSTEVKMELNANQCKLTPDSQSDINDNNVDLTEDHRTSKYEWVKVGSKRKSTIKGKLKEKGSQGSSRESSFDRSGGHNATIIQVAILSLDSWRHHLHAIQWTRHVS